MGPAKSNLDASAQARDKRNARRAHALHGSKARRAKRRSKTLRMLGMDRLAEDADQERKEHESQAQLAKKKAGPSPPKANMGDGVVRIVAGFNNVVISAVAGLAFARVVQWLFPDTWWAILGVGVLAFVGVDALLAHWGPLRWGPRVHFAAWVVVGLAAVAVSAPLGLLLIAGVAVATVGRALARQQPEMSVSGLLRSPLPWALLTVYALVGVAYYATPPVTFQRAVLATVAGDRVGGYLRQTSDGVYLVTCDPRANATSTDERVVLVRSTTITATTIGGTEVSLDSGQRPSLATLALSALGIDAHPPLLIRADLRASRAACTNVAPLGLTIGSADPALGQGAIVGPPPVGRQARDGEPPIQNQHTPFAVAQLALKYQPTVEVTVADRFWPVSVGAVLHDVGSYGSGRTCLMSAATFTCKPVTTIQQFTPGNGNINDYLWYPAKVQGDPTNQFQAFEAGQGIRTGSADSWLMDPGVLDPWSTAQVYFYYAGRIKASKWPGALQGPTAPSDLIGLEYWFFYPFNYYPTVVGAEVMPDAPLAADQVNTDLHQGDWEHITVLLQPGTLTPEWVYMARHDGEGSFYRWNDQSLLFDRGHPVVQAAFGGHPTYDNNCGGRPRAKIGNVSSDWLVCGTGRFAFQATTTPLVDIAQTRWACWKGHFGEAKPGLEVNGRNEQDIIAAGRELIYVKGPGSPLRQGENAGVACSENDPAAAERTASADGVR